MAIIFPFFSFYVPIFYFITILILIPIYEREREKGGEGEREGENQCCMLCLKSTLLPLLVLLLAWDRTQVPPSYPRLAFRFFLTPPCAESTKYFSFVNIHAFILHQPIAVHV